jgi:adenine-specific DNA methylase
MKDVFENYNVKDKASKEIAKIHKYWARKPITVVDKFISEYSKENDYVLDPFCGSGTFGISATSLDRNYIGYDLNPISNLICKVVLSKDKELNEFKYELDNLTKEIKKEIMELYKFEKNYIKYQITNEKNSEVTLALTDFDLNRSSQKKVQIQKSKVKESKYNISNIPDNLFPKEFYKDRFSYKGYSKVSDFYTNRNLKALSILQEQINKINGPSREYFLLCFSNTLLHVSDLKSENVRPLSVNNYWIPEDYLEENVWWRFEERCRRFIEGLKFLSDEYSTTADSKIYKSSGIYLKNTKENSIDYIITDPPYGDVIQYSELSFIWNTWLEKTFNTKDELIINPKQKKDSNFFLQEFAKFSRKTKLVLKKDKFFTLCFHNKNLSIWTKLLNIIFLDGFELVNISIYNNHGNSFNNNWSKFSPKSDFYLTFKNTRKSKRFYEKMEFSELININSTSNKNISTIYDNIVSDIIFNIFQGIQILNITDNKIEKLLEQ